MAKVATIRATVWPGRIPRFARPHPHTATPEAC
jgi:hypothetical protein